MEEIMDKDKISINEISNNENKEVISFRQCKITDSNAMNKLNRIILPENYSINDWNYVLSRFSHLSFVAFCKKELVGYCLCMQTAYDETMIASIGVHDKYRRKGIAQKLLDLSIQASAKQPCIKSIKLNVRVGNKNAQRLYVKNSFIPKSREKNYYDNGEDAFVLQKKINEI